jgi:catechol 2,3-dioxygenase-like lactoylglutathione lyase family enzyme
VKSAPASLGAITLFVDDPERSKAFNAKVFDLAPGYEDENAAAIKFENTIVNLLRRSEAGELVSPVRERRDRLRAAASFQLTIWVDDTDAVCAELADRGVELLNGPIERPWGLRTASFADPDGHVWEVAAELRRGGEES